MGQRIVLAVFLLAHIALAAPATTQSTVEVARTKIDAGPTPVSLKLNKVSASEMFSKLAQEAKISLIPQNDSLWDEPALAEASFSTEWDKAPLWEAVREACEAAGVRVMPDESNEGDGRVQLHSGPLPGHLAIDGPVMVWPRNLVRSASVSYGTAPPKPDEVRLTLMVLPEPRLQRFIWYNRPTIDKAEDNQGHSLLRGGPGDLPRGSASGSNLAVLLDYPAKVGNRIAIISGSISMEVASELATVSFRAPFDKLENVTADVGPNRLVLKSMRLEGGGYRANLSLLRGKDQSDEHWTALAESFGRYTAPITLVGFRGESRRNGGSTGWSGEEAHADTYFSNREPGDEATELRVVLPVKFEPLTTKFEFKDLPMP